MVKIEMTELMAGVLTRLLVDEIDNQRDWIEEDKERHFPDKHIEVRERIIAECMELIGKIEKQGITPYFKDGLHYTFH